MSEIDYYQILQIAPGASQAELRSAYKRLALRYHPDHSSSPLATQRMQLLNQAYDVLSDQEKRARYDARLLRQAVVAPPPMPTWRPSPRPAHPKAARRKAAWRAPAKSTAARRAVDAGKQRVWMVVGLALIFSTVVLVLGMFAWSLLTGQVNLLLVFVLVLFAVFVLGVMVYKVWAVSRNP